MEDKNYGFERNLGAIRLEGLVISLASAAALGVTAIVQQLSHPQALNLTSLLVAFAVCGLLVSFWAWWPSEPRVRRADSTPRGSSTPPPSCEAVRRMRHLCRGPRASPAAS